MMHRIAYATALFGLTFACTGCLAGSLVGSTGPRPANVARSDAPRQLVHTGETVDFDFVLHDGIGRFIPARGWADYGIVTIRSERLHVEPDHRGRFRFSYRFDVQQPAERITVRATAMRQRDHCDYMPDRRGFIMRGPTPEGIHSISYLPTGGELDPIRETEIEFAINDIHGRTCSARTQLKTP